MGRVTDARAEMRASEALVAHQILQGIPSEPTETPSTIAGPRQVLSLPPRTMKTKHGQR